MRTPTLAVVVIGLAVARPSAAQEPAGFDRPRAALFSREATRNAVLAAAREYEDETGGQTSSPRLAEWSRVLRIAPGTTVQLQTTNHPLAPAEVFTADADGLIVLRLDDAVAPKDARLLRQYAYANPASVLGLAEGRSVTSDKLRLSPDGIFIDGRRLGNPERIFERVPRDGIVEILSRSTTTGSALGATLGAVGGFFLGGVLAAANAFNGGPEAVSWVAFLGTPIAVGFLGYHAGGGTETLVIYRR